MTASSSRPTISPDRLANRLERARTIAAAQGVHALLVGVGADLVYLTGYDARALERLTMLVVPAAGRATLIAPRLEGTPARGCAAATSGAIDVMTWEETDDAHALALDLARAGAPPAVRFRAAVSERLWARHVLAFRDRLGDAEMGLATSVLRELRMAKDADEVELLRLAAHAADRTMAAIAAGRLIGRTERDVAAEILARLVAEGHDSAEFAIVASGPNSASPHHDPSDRVIRAGEPIVLDIGGLLGGYGSDITRTIWVGGADPASGPTEPYRHLHGVLLAAQAAASAAVAPGVACEAIDTTARDRIAAEGYGEQFIHRTGHGIGLEIHEEPYLVAGNAEPLAVGMAFSVEPGIYVDGEFGARIEDIVVCGPSGPDILNQAPRELLVVEG